MKKSSKNPHNAVRSDRRKLSILVKNLREQRVWGGNLWRKFSPRRLPLIFFAKGQRDSVKQITVWRRGTAEIADYIRPLYSNLRIVPRKSSFVVRAVEIRDFIT